ncbi:ElyC/SanA/YdcF family protein [Lacticaseibacillus baoqingensis]|uniref:ElyC/SanA/YdcF family protein n=1 Tax=Lacticaseibacillus baoqingensis TaxID=2486013 RepID=A0ABW4E8K2_9LACO|nr:ElyC/SanA/YdcF family protein [Lacticaseibacillus baoqingensis]
MALADSINQLAAFCGPRQVPQLTQPNMQRLFGRPQADVCVLFGGTIIAGGEVLAQAIRQKVAQHYVIVGGYGHTTAQLFAQMQHFYPQVPPATSEAALFANWLKDQHGLNVDWLEQESTNCGNNITNLLALLQAHAIVPKSLILMQDATMQRRMSATLAKYAPQAAVCDYATYQVRVVQVHEQLQFVAPPLGMWPMDHYIRLLCGEIVRLRDDAQGYGPKGRDYLAHVTLPATVESAFETVIAAFPAAIRQANSAYASRHR